jgi:hypothetical protein
MHPILEPLEAESRRSSRAADVREGGHGGARGELLEVPQQLVAGGLSGESNAADVAKSLELCIRLANRKGTHRRGSAVTAPTRRRERQRFWSSDANSTASNETDCGTPRNAPLAPVAVLRRRGAMLLLLPLCCHRARQRPHQRAHCAYFAVRGTSLRRQQGLRRHLKPPGCPGRLTSNAACPPRSARRRGTPPHSCVGVHGADDRPDAPELLAAMARTHAFRSMCLRMCVCSIGPLAFSRPAHWRFPGHGP